MKRTINQRIKKIADNLCDGNISEMARITGVKQPSLRDIATGKQDQPGYDMLRKIVDSSILNISSDWLLTGKGAMQIHKQKTDKDDNRAAIPVFNISAAGSLQKLFTSNNEHKTGEVSIPNAPDCDGAIYVFQNSMYPLIKGGDLAVYKQLHNIQNLIEGEMYLLDYHIEGDDFLVLRYVKWEEKSTSLRLVSYNEHYEDMIIPVSAVRAIALVKMVVTINSMG